MALLPPSFLDCVVAIGLRTQPDTTEWVASGFLYGLQLEQVGEKQSLFRIYLVTNRHVFADQREAYVRFNPESDEAAKEFRFQLLRPDGTQRWYAHPDPEVDIAVAEINGKALRDQHIKFNFFRSNQSSLDIQKSRELGISEGDGAYILGFPMGLVGGERNFVIVRQGNIARIRDALFGSAKEFLVDGSVFPGNSGGPVVTRPEVTSIAGTKPVSRSYLIGVVKGYVPYQDVAYSAQTKRPRIVFEENSGLTSVIPIDFINVPIQQHESDIHKVGADSTPESAPSG